MTARLTDEDLDMACLAPDDDADPWPASLVRRLAHELRERRARDANRGHYARIGAIADALPIDPEAERKVDALMAKARAGHVARKLTMPALSDFERIVLLSHRDRIDGDPLTDRAVVATLDRLLSGGRK